MNESSVKVTGTGRIHVVPDVTRLEIEINRVFQTYEQAYNCVKENSTFIVKILEYNKQPGQLAKTTYLDISDNMVSKYDKGGHHIGYKKEGYI